MATIMRQVALDRHADEVWEELSDFSAAAELFEGAVTSCKTDGDLRAVTFANGLKINQRLVTVDGDERRLVYTSLNSFYSHHMASLQVVPRGNGCSVVWITDFLPDTVEPWVAPLVEAGYEALQRTLVKED